MPELGSVFEKKYHGKIYKLKVVNSITGIAYEIDGLLFKTPTAAAKSITKNEVNGWEFWKIDKTRPKRTNP